MTLDASLHFCSSNRAFALGQHQAYVAGVKNKLLPAFDNIEAEADRFVEQEYERLYKMPGWANGPDLSDLDERAHQEGISHYHDLVFVKGELTAFATAGMYHLWERTLKAFFVREAAYLGMPAKAKQKIQQANYDKICEWLALMGFVIGECPYADDLSTVRHVANTVKHGDGRSCRELARSAPELLRGPCGIEIPFGEPSAEDLWIEADTFAKYATAIEAFWNDFPEKLAAPTEWFKNKGNRKS